MNFFAKLLAKLTGGADAPKTLEAARATHAEAKTALDSIGKLFAAANIDFDALMAKGENALRDFVAELQGKVTTAEAAVTAANDKVTAAEAKVAGLESQVSGFRSQVSTLEGLLSSVGFTPKADAKPEEVQAAFKTHVSGAVTQQLQEIGQPERTLPAASGSAAAAETEADLLAQLAETKDPVLKGKIGAKLNALRDQAWGATAGKN